VSCLRSIFVLFLSVSVLAASPSGMAQPVPAEPAAPDPAATTPEHARLLAELLQDEEARQALIDQLLRIAEDEGGEAAPERAAPEDEISIASGVAAYTREFAEAVSETMYEVQAWAIALWAGLRAGGDADLEALGEAGLALASIIALTLIIYYALGFVASALFRWLAGRARNGSRLKRVALLMVSGLIDAFVLLVAWAGGYILALNTLGEAGRMNLYQSLYLNAFLLVEMSKVVLRLFLVPRYPELRLVRLPDLQANYWYFWLSRIIGLLGYGMLLMVPIVSEHLSWRVGVAVEYVIGLTALIMAIVVILQNREGLRRVLEARAQARAREGDVVSRLLLMLARVWHWVAIVYCIAFFVTWVVRSEDALPFMIRATAESIGLIVLGVLVTGVISRAITGGLRLPEEVRTRLPLLETRLNAFVPAVLQVVRILVLIIVALLVARAWGLFDVVDWVASAAGRELVTRTIGVVLILMVAGLLWLALSSWVDYRLNPDLARPAGARERTLLALLRNAATIALATVTLMLVLSELGVNIAPLLAGAGVVGLAIGFGAQKLVQDIITGAFIQFENAINEGEVVTAGGLTGVVERLTIRSVGLRDLQGVYHIIPFSSVDSVSNFMRGFGFHVAEIGVAYRENIDEARALMHEAFDELRQDPELGPTIIEPLEWHGLTAFGDSAIILRARIKTRPGQQWAVGRAYNAIIKRLFDEHGIEIPFPHLTLYFGQNKDGSAPPMHAVIDRLPEVMQAKVASAGPEADSTGLVPKGASG
jgi:small-conductance mechanosensitive channel